MPRAKKKQAAPFVINYTPYGITLTEHKNKLDRHYGGNLKQFRDDMQANPYHVFVDICDMSFTYADAIIMCHHHSNSDAYCRCQYAAYAVLQKNEVEGNTRMTDAELARGVNEVAHEAMPHIVDVVKNDPLLHFIQRLRDESHRFAITYSRSLALKNISKSPLLNIQGMGEKRLKQLLTAIPDIHTRKELSVNIIRDYGKLPQELAERVYEYILNEKNNKY